SASDSQNSIDLLGGRLRSVVAPIVRLHPPRRVAVRVFGTNHVGKSGATALNGQTVGIDGQAGAGLLNVVAIDRLIEVHWSHQHGYAEVQALHDRVRSTVGHEDAC